LLVIRVLALILCTDYRASLFICMCDASFGSTDEMWQVLPEILALGAAIS